MAGDHEDLDELRHFECDPELQPLPFAQRGHRVFAFDTGAKAHELCGLKGACR